MNIKEIILKEHTKANCTEIINWIGNNQKHFDELVNLFTGDDKLIAQRAGWPLSYSANAHPELITKHIGKLLQNLKKQDIHDAIKRNTIRMLEKIDIPEAQQGAIMNICFDYLISQNEKPAVKAFSLTVLENLSIIYPEIKKELKTVIEDRWDFESAAFKSRGRKILKRL